MKSDGDDDGPEAMAKAFKHIASAQNWNMQYIWQPNRIGNDLKYFDWFYLDIHFC